MRGGDWLVVLMRVWVYAGVIVGVIFGVLVAIVGMKVIGWLL